MSANWNEEPESAVTVYRGAPARPNEVGEESRWRKFCTWICPWLRRKRQLGDDYLEAEVLNRQADAMVKLAQATKTFAEAEKIAKETVEISARMDNARAEAGLDQVQVAIEGVREADLEKILRHELDALEEKLKSARLKYGVRLLEVKKEPPQLTDGSEKSATQSE